MGSYGKALAVVAVAVLAFASLMVVNGGPGRDAQAQTPGALTIEKVCVGHDEGTFEVFVDIEFEPDIGPGIDGAIDEDNDFDFTFLLDCGQTSLFDDSVGAVQDLFDYVNTYFDELDSATVEISELNVPALVTDTYEDCSLSDTIENFGTTFDDTGYHCTITNTFDLPDLTLEKDCPNGPGTSQFSVIVREAGGGPVVGFDNTFNCTDVLVVPNLAPGLYEVSEIIGGPDEFDTEIECNDASGLHSQNLRLIVTSLDLEANALCVITNTLVEDDDVDGDGLNINNTNNNIINVNSTNTNDNANNNNNANENANNNANENNNANTNTQNQTNDQDQTNNNTQTTNVDSSPQVNISGAGAPGGGGVFVAPPSTGDGGLLGLQRQEAGYVTWLAAASVLLMLGVAKARSLRNED